MTRSKQTITLPEWATHEVAGLELTEDDRRLVDELSGLLDKRLVIEELRGRTRICSTSWIGVVQLCNLEIQVLPKLAGGNLGVLEMIEQTSGLDALEHGSGAREIDAEGTNLYDLFVLLLVEECERILRSGVFGDYAEEVDALPVLRGRLLFDRQLRQCYGQLDKLICRYDEYRQDIIENQILAYALDYSERRVRHAAIARRAHQVGTIFREVCDWTSLDPGGCWDDLTYHRLNEHYRQAHVLARLVTKGAGVTSLYGRGSTDCFAFLIDMNLLFERFVRCVLEAAVRPWNLQVSYQKAESSVVWDALENRPYRKIVPDFVLIERGTVRARLAIDAKYKLYDERKVQPGDIYQMFLYSYAYAEDAELPRAVLIYPSENLGGLSSHLQIRTVARSPRASLFVMGINIPVFLEALKTRNPGPAITDIGRTLAEYFTSETTGTKDAPHGRLGAVLIR